MSLKTLTLLGLLAFTPALAQSTPATPTATELLQRVFNSDGLGGGTRTEVLLGRVPADFGIKLPPGSRVVGTVSQVPGREDLPVNTTVYFDTSLTPEQTLASFAGSLGSGWREAPQDLEGPFGNQGGFVPSLSVSNRIFYRQSPAQLVQVSTQITRGVTQVSVRKQQGGETERMLAFIEVRPPLLPASQRLPRLVAPAGSTITPQGGGSSGDGLTQQARVETKLDRKALVEHYAAQLRAAGWTLVNQAATDQVTTTIWSLTQDGKERVGLLIIGGRTPYTATLMTQTAR